MIKLTDEERNSYIMWANVQDVRGNRPAECLAIALRRCNAARMRLEFNNSSHTYTGNGYPCSYAYKITGEFCTDPRHDYDWQAWLDASHKELMGEP